MPFVVFCQFKRMCDNILLAFNEHIHESNPVQPHKLFSCPNALRRILIFNIEYQRSIQLFIFFIYYIDNRTTVWIVVLQRIIGPYRFTGNCFFKRPHCVYHASLANRGLSPEPNGKLFLHRCKIAVEAAGSNPHYSI